MEETKEEGTEESRNNPPPGKRDDGSEIGISEARDSRNQISNPSIVIDRVEGEKWRRKREEKQGFCTVWWRD